MGKKKTKQKTPPSGQDYSAFDAADTISKRKYQQYKTMVETSGGKNVPLPYSQWDKAGRPAQ